MTTATTPTSSTPRFNAGKSIGVTVIVLALLGGGWYVSANRVPRPENASDFRPDPGGRRGGFFMGNAQRGQGFTVTPTVREPVSVGPRIVTARAEDMTLSCTLRADGNWTINVSFNGESLGGREEQQLLRAVRRTVESKQPPASLKLTDAQRSQLAAIPLSPPELTADQLKQLTDLLNQSQKLKANAPEMAGIKASLVAVAAQIKAIDREAAKAKHAERDAKFRSILSADQINNLLGANPARPAPAAQ